MMLKLTFGTDPEVFLTDPEGKYVSAHDLIPGSKVSPFPVQRGALQPDGVSAEFNIDPVEDEDSFIESIETVMNQMKDHIKTLRPDLTVTYSPTAIFDEAYFESLPNSAKELGCSPDYDAYTGEPNQPPETAEPFRTGSGHMHIGWGSGFVRSDYEHFDTCCLLVQQLDAVLYVASLLWDHDEKRRTLYGKMGSFRPCSYGVEYRPLSNKYLSSKKIQRYVFNTTRMVSDLLLNQGVRLTDEDFVAEMLERILYDDYYKPSEDEIHEYLIMIENQFGIPRYE